MSWIKNLFSFQPTSVPLGVAGKVTVTQAEVEALGGAPLTLKNDQERIAYIAQRLRKALGNPLTGLNSRDFLKPVLEHSFDADMILIACAQKALETLRDGERHSRLMISFDEPLVGISFSSWSGSHLEFQTERHGEYLSSLFGVAHGMVQKGICMEAMLAVDVFIREAERPNELARGPQESFKLDVEIAYLPGPFFGLKTDMAPQLPRVLMINTALCTGDELQFLESYKR